VYQRRARLAANKRHHPDADHSPAERDLCAEKLAEHVKKVVAQAPPLSDEQIERIALLMRAGSAE